MDLLASYQLTKGISAENSRQTSKRHLIWFGMLHLVIWIIMYFKWGWLGILLGFSVNCILDMGMLSLCVLLQKEHSVKNSANVVKD